MMVRLGKQVGLADLESALVKAAEDLGYKAEVKKVTKEVYGLGSGKMAEEYDHAHVNIGKGIIPLMKIEIYEKRGPVEIIFIEPKSIFATHGRTEKYLAAVSGLI